MPQTWKIGLICWSLRILNMFNLGDLLRVCENFQSTNVWRDEINSFSLKKEDILSIVWLESARQPNGSKSNMYSKVESFYGNF